VVQGPTTFLAMHVCNLGEVYYDFFRADGLTAAETAWTNTLALPLVLRRDADDAFMQRVGVTKVAERISFANAFALALAERFNIPLVTTDHHECDAIKRKGHFRFMWLRSFLRITAGAWGVWPAVLILEINWYRTAIRVPGLGS
jgi:hypothetical protein